MNSTTDVIEMQSMSIGCAACDALAKAVHELRSCRDEIKALRARLHQGPDRALEKQATELWVRAEDRLREMIDVRRELVYSVMREAGRQIDPNTAEVFGGKVDICDPYGLDPQPDYCIGTVRFARAPGTALWVDFHDLPDATVDVLEQRIKRGEFEPDDWPL